MNNLDMYTREKVNKIHLDEMHREAQNRQILRDSQGKTDPKIIKVDQRRIIALAKSILIGLVIGIPLAMIGLSLLHNGIF
jgi:hypothetical protein